MRIPNIISYIIDSLSNAIKIIDYEHSEIHSGDHFTFTKVATLADAAKLEYLIIAPDTDKNAHLIFDVSGVLDTLVELFETSTHTTGAVQAVYNNNRNSAKVNTTTINASGGGGVDGTKIYESQFGIDAGVGNNRITDGGEDRGSREWILKRNTKYLLRITSRTDNNNVSEKLSWYEHTGRT